MNPKLARKITTRLAESGQPPERGVSEFNVGTEELLRTLKDEYLTTILAEDGGSTFKLVEAQYGGGKTHFLRCLQDIAWQQNFAVSLVELDQHECPYDNPLLVYKAVVRNISAPPAAEDEDSEPGLQPFLQNLIYTRREQFEKSRDPAAEQQRWLDSFRAADIESTVFREALYAALSGHLHDDREIFDLLTGWILGENPPLQRLRKAIGIGERIDKSNSFMMLRSLCQAVRALDFSGLLILFDEGYRMVSLMSAKKQMEACENLVSIINYCGHAKLPGAMFAYAVPPNFRSDIVPRYEALRQRLEMTTPFSRSSPMSPVIDLEGLTLEPEELLLAIGEKLLPIIATARKHEYDAEIQRENIKSLAHEAVEKALDVNSRRIFVKALANLLISQAVDGETRLSPPQVEAHVRKTNESLQGASGGDEF